MMLPPVESVASGIPGIRNGKGKVAGNPRKGVSPFGKPSGEASMSR
jgi:hypothetical protein